jgi:hypothetical protein
MTATILDRVERAVTEAAKKPVIHIETVPVVETFNGETIWEGMVEVFAVSNPPPSRAYG